MTDRNPYIATKYPRLSVVESTTPQPGEVILMRHGAYRAIEGGGYEPARVAAPIAHANAGPAMPLHQWPSLPVWALMGLLMGLLVVWGICS